MRENRQKYGAGVDETVRQHHRLDRQDRTTGELAVREYRGEYHRPEQSRGRKRQQRGAGDCIQTGGRSRIPRLR